MPLDHRFTINRRFGPFGNKNTLCKPSDDCPNTVTRLAQVKDIDYHTHITWAIKQRAMMLLTTNQSQKDLAKKPGCF